MYSFPDDLFSFLCFISDELNPALQNFSMCPPLSRGGGSVPAIDEFGVCVREHESGWLCYLLARTEHFLLLLRWVGGSFLPVCWSGSVFGSIW